MKKTMGSWLASANKEGIDFPIENLPYGVFRRKHTQDTPRIAVAIGDCVLDCALLVQSAADEWEGDTQTAVVMAALCDENLNAFMAMGRQARILARRVLTRVLSASYAKPQKIQACLLPQADVDMLLPCRIGDYTDFYTSIHHATAVGKMFRPDNPLLPNYQWVPIGYHGRSSSIGVSGQAVVRPKGQTKQGDAPPQFTACKRLDYELEMGIFVGQSNTLGAGFAIDEAEDHLFGMCLLNDWSARDLQAWEYQPLGPFLAKNFASTLSPWIVTLEALQPFRTPWHRPEQDPQPLPYLESQQNRKQGGFDIKMEVLLHTTHMQQQGLAAQRVGLSNFAYAYWTVAQMLTHHSSNGCNLQAGDLLGSGTMSGPKPEEAGSLLELSQGGKAPISLGSGETRTFLEDGDTVIMRAYCDAPHAVPIGFGQCVGTVLPATN